MVRAWLDGTNVGYRVTQRFVSAAAQAESISHSELGARLAGHAPAQIEQLMSRWAHHAGCSAELARTLLCGADGDLERWIERGFPRTLRDLKRFTDLVPILITGNECHRPEWISSALRVAIGLATHVPTLDIAVAVTPEAIAGWQPVGSPRERAMVAEGLVVIASHHAESCAGPVGRAPVRKDEPAHASTPGAHHFANPPSQQSMTSTPRARSAAEALLFGILQARAHTRERFVLNASVTAQFGSAPLEIDLLCESLKLAIEVDGYHHFTDSVAYRRDRRKDVVLQELGYMVVRVLATDITDECDYVLSVIERAIAQREQRMQ
jgi:very-short-patch-repair endonuclease